MKKFLLLILLISFTYSEITAQSIKLVTKDGKEIANDSLMVSALSSDDVVEIPIFIKNLTETNLNVLVKKYELELVSGSEAYFCWDKCYANTSFLATTALTANSNDTIKAFSGDYKPLGNTGLSKVMYTFFKYKDTNDSASVTIYYDIVTVGIEDVNTLKKSISSYPNPATNYLNFNYKLGNNNKGEIYIYDLVGKKVKQKNISNTKDYLQINISDLNSGIYIWTIVVDGIPVKSEKLIKK